MCKSKKNIWNGKIYFIRLVYVKVIRINITGGEITSRPRCLMFFGEGA